MPFEGGAGFASLGASATGRAEAVGGVATGGKAPIGFQQKADDGIMKTIRRGVEPGAQGGSRSLTVSLTSGKVNSKLCTALTNRFDSRKET